MTKKSKQPEREAVQKDQRRNLRAPLIVYRLRFDDGQKTFFGYSKNISRGGLFIATVNPREPGSRFTVEIPLPPPLKRVVSCTCEVVWSRPYDRKSPFEPGMGLKFLDLSEADAEALDRWVSAVED
jgi:uncharacterized protein (TIGR02266 family)